MNLWPLSGAIRDWDAAVCAEAERLIELGVPPWDAVIQARQRVSACRRQRVADKRDPIPRSLGR